MIRFFFLILIFFLNNALNAQVTVRTLNKTDNSIIYCNIENTLLIDAPGTDISLISFKTNGAIISGEKGYFKIKPNNCSGTITLEVFKNGSSIAKQQLKILNIPDPQFCYANVCGVNIDVPISSTKSPLIAKIEGFSFDKYPKIASFTLRVGGKKFIGNGNEITDTMHDAIKNVGKGGQIYFSNIICVMPYGEERKLQDVKVILK